VFNNITLRRNVVTYQANLNSISKIWCLWLFFATILVSPAHAADLPCVSETTLDVATLKSRIVIIGELHGTNEIPAFTADLACALLKNGKKLILGLEVPTDRQEAISTYMASQGTDADKAKLIDSDFGKLEDGRSSHAIFNLVDSMRKIQKAGGQVVVMAYDISVGNLPQPLYPNEKLWSGERNMAMARNIESRARVYKDHTILILTGFTHAYRSKGAPWDAEYEPMAYLLTQRMFTPHIISMSSTGGEAWGCTKPGADGKLKCQINMKNKFGWTSPADDDPDVDSWVAMGRISASIPVRQKEIAK
jgi:hypothetical protein